MKGVTIFTDGSCLGNPGPGGWACILRYGQRERVLQGVETKTTNNPMELLAAIRGLEVLTETMQGHRHHRFPLFAARHDDVPAALASSELAKQQRRGHR